MNEKIKYLNFFILIFILFISFSHTFIPYRFSISLPTSISAKLNEELNINLIIKNEGMIGDFYEINVTPNTNDIYVSLRYANISLEPETSSSIPIRIIVYSSLGNKRVDILVCSKYLESIYGKAIQNCNAQLCVLESEKSCIQSTINFRIATFSLGIFYEEFIILPLFLLVFVILLSFVKNMHQKL